MRAVIIGGCGFLGLHIAEKLASEKIKTVLIDSEERKQNIPSQSGVNLVEIDYPYTNMEVISSTIEDSDVVIHLGWSDVPNENALSFHNDISNNIMNSAKIFHLAVKSKASKIIFASSGGSVYGNANQSPIDETCPTSPISSYGIAKLTAENYLQLLTSHSSTRFAIFRIGNAYGSHLAPGLKHTGLIPSILQALVSNEEIEIWGDGRNVRDFIHVSDIADAFYIATINDEIKGLFNLGTGQGTTLVELIALIEKKLNKKLKIRWGAERNCDVKSVILNYDKFNKLSDWEPTFSLEQGIEEIIIKRSDHGTT